MRNTQSNGFFYVKVKILSLAAEAKIIRQQENKARRHKPVNQKGEPTEPEDCSRCKGKGYHSDRERNNSSLRVGLAEHRQGIVRHEARHAQLAYAFLRGIPYYRLERKCHPGSEPNFTKVWSSIERYVLVRDWDKETNDEYKERIVSTREAFDKWKRSPLEAVS